eukprot:CAMPEP_0195110808 /NCGR_PEP_ID=MMETSP0448-20130528/94009_1 /TAXON_ID=66468 /ORGANISM="Heterocapsa triquestra, Strain CCMP 448" /LENGTH=63 /DNA_ID=CAMNT_0040147541 /DNA_START=61 /DNA_END=252 /DNA_ORIENTATION=-
MSSQNRMLGNKMLGDQSVTPRCLQQEAKIRAGLTYLATLPTTATNEDASPEASKAYLHNSLTG